jgi:hypothetical protein
MTIDQRNRDQNLGDDTQHADGCGFCGRRMGHQIGCPARG